MFLPGSQKSLPETDFIDPLMSKKPRISHLSNRGPPASSGRHPLQSEDKKPTPPVTAACPGPSLHPASGSSSNSPCTPEGRGSQDLPLDQSSICGNSSENYAPRSHTPSPTSQPGSTTSPSFSTCTVSTTTVTSTTTSSQNLLNAASPTGSHDGNGTKKPRKSKKHKDKEKNQEGGRERGKERKRDREQRREDHCDKEAQPRKKQRNEAEQKHIPANISREPDAGLCALYSRFVQM